MADQRSNTNSTSTNDDLTNNPSPPSDSNSRQPNSTSFLPSFTTHAVTYEIHPLTGNLRLVLDNPTPPFSNRPMNQPPSTDTPGSNPSPNPSNESQDSTTNDSANPPAGDNPPQGMENTATHHLMHRVARNIATMMHRVLSNGQAQRPPQPQAPQDAIPPSDTLMNAEQPSTSSVREGSIGTEPNPPTEAFASRPETMPDDLHDIPTPLSMPPANPPNNPSQPIDPTTQDGSNNNPPTAETGPQQGPRPPPFAGLPPAAIILGFDLPPLPTNGTGPDGAVPDASQLPPFPNFANFIREVLMGMAMRNEAERPPDTRRAKELLRGLPVAPHGLIRRLERVEAYKGDLELDGSGQAKLLCTVCCCPLIPDEGDADDKEAPMQLDDEEDVDMSSDDKSQQPTPSTEVDASKRKLQSLFQPRYPSLAPNALVSLPCNHIFHAVSCLKPWFEQGKTTCPTCRFDIDPRSETLDLNAWLGSGNARRARNEANAANAANPVTPAPAASTSTSGPTPSGNNDSSPDTPMPQSPTNLEEARNMFRDIFNLPSASDIILEGPFPPMDSTDQLAPSDSVSQSGRSAQQEPHDASENLPRARRSSLPAGIGRPNVPPNIAIEDFSMDNMMPFTVSSTPTGPISDIQRILLGVPELSAPQTTPSEGDVMSTAATISSTPNPASISTSTPNLNDMRPSPSTSTLPSDSTSPTPSGRGPLPGFIGPIPPYFLAGPNGRLPFGQPPARSSSATPSTGGLPRPMIPGLGLGLPNSSFAHPFFGPNNSTPTLNRVQDGAGTPLGSPTPSTASTSTSHSNPPASSLSSSSRPSTPSNRHHPYINLRRPASVSSANSTVGSPTPASHRGVGSDTPNTTNSTGDIPPAQQNGQTAATGQQANTDGQNNERDMPPFIRHSITLSFSFGPPEGIPMPPPGWFTQGNPSGNEDRAGANPSPGSPPTDGNPPFPPRGVWVDGGIWLGGGNFPGPREGPGSRRSDRPKKKWVPPEGTSLRSIVESKEREIGLRCHDVTCLWGPEDDDESINKPLEESMIKKERMWLRKRGDPGEPACQHRFHPECLLVASRISEPFLEEAISRPDGDEDEELEAGCPFCRVRGVMRRSLWRRCEAAAQSL